MKKLLILFAFLCNMHNVDAQDDDWEVLIDEQFDEKATFFDIVNDGTIESKLASGRYFFSYNDIKNPNFVSGITIETGLKPTDDYMIQLSLTLLEGGYNKKTNRNQGFGLIWGFLDWSNYLRLLITKDEYSMIGGTIAGSSIDIKKWEREYSLNEGNSVNTITLIKENNYFKIYYGNYFEEKSVDDILSSQDLMGDRVGFYIPNGCKIAVDYITVKRKSYAMKNAIAKYDQKDYESAIKDFSEIISRATQQNKTLSKAYGYRSACYVQQEKLDLGMLDCKEAISIDPTNEWAYYIKGYIHAQKNEKDEALKALYKSGDLGKELIAEINSPIVDNSKNSSSGFKSSGSGFALSTDGYVATNWHVVDEAKNIVIQVNRNGEAKDYKAKIVYADKTNDLAILKIDDANFSSFGKIPYTLKKQMLDVGTSIFAMGYPLLSSLGDEVKLTDGLVSSKTGYQGDIVTYQISAPIQPGNSGGPLFDKKGNLVGITNAGIPGAENVGYAIKANYLVNLLEMLPETVQLSTVNTLQTLPFTSQVKELSKFVFIIKIR
jgi:S1-C subfamily serine protease